MLVKWGREDSITKAKSSEKYFFKVSTQKCGPSKLLKLVKYKRLPYDIGFGRSEGVMNRT